MLFLIQTRNTWCYTLRSESWILFFQETINCQSLVFAIQINIKRRFLLPLSTCFTSSDEKSSFHLHVDYYIACWCKFWEYWDGNKMARNEKMLQSHIMNIALLKMLKPHHVGEGWPDYFRAWSTIQPVKPSGPIRISKPCNPYLI